MTIVENVPEYTPARTGWWERPAPPPLPSEPVSEWTDQQVLDHVSLWLLSQAVQSRSCGLRGTCSYRGLAPGGQTLACAVGALLPDALARDLDAWRAGSVASLVSRFTGTTQVATHARVWLGAEMQTHGERDGIFCFDRTPRTRLLIDLQEVHDGYLPEHWPEQLARAARTHDLAVPECVTSVLLSRGQRTPDK